MIILIYHEINKLFLYFIAQESEQFSGQKGLKVTTSGDVQATTPHDLQRVQATMQATGISPAGQVFAHQDPAVCQDNPGSCQHFSYNINYCNSSLMFFCF